MWPVLFTAAARAELIEAQDWYEAQASGLSHRFRAEIDSVVQRMTDNPRQFPVVFKTLRRARAKKFPYALFFSSSPMPSWLSLVFMPAAIRVNGKSGSSFIARS